MHFWALLVLPTTSFALVPRARDPCANIAGKAWVKPSELTACLSYFPFNPTLRNNVADVVSRTFAQFHTSTSFHIHMADPYTDDTVDLIAEMNRIKRTTYKSDFEVHQDVSQQVKRLGDGHANYVNYCYDSVYVTYLPFPIAPLVTPKAPNVQNIYIVPEAYEIVKSAFGADAIKLWQSALGRSLTNFNGARVVSINGQDPWTYIDNLAAHSGKYQARTTRQNGFFASYKGHYYLPGDFAQLTLPPKTDTITLTLIRNGATAQETYKVPYLSRLGSASDTFTDAKSFWAKNCRPTASTNGSPFRVSPTPDSPDGKVGTQLTVEDPYSRPARFQSDPIRPQIEDGKWLAVSSIVNDGPQDDIKLPSSLNPSGSVNEVGPMSWYMLGDGKTAVLQLSSFSGEKLRTLQAGVLDGVNQVKAKGATRLLVDLSNNGGGAICLAAWLHRVLAGPQPGINIQPGLDGSVRAQSLPQKIVAKIVANNAGADPLMVSLYNPRRWKGTNGKTFAADFNWLNPAIGVQANGVSDRFSQKIGDICLPFSLTPPTTKPFEFKNIAIMTNGRCASSCSLFSITMAIKYRVKTIVVGGRQGTTQQYCGMVGGESTNLVTMDSEVKTFGLKKDPLAPPDFLTNSYQGITWKLDWSILDPNSFEEFKAHPAQLTFPLLPSTVNNPMALWKDVSKRLWPN